MRRRPAAGFTLIEIIVVVLVFSVMAAMAYGGLNSVLKTRRGIETSFDRTADFERAFQRMRSDFQNTRYRPIRDAFGDTQASVTADRNGVVSVTRGGWRNPMSASRSSLERVSYKLVDKKLTRSSYRVLDQATDSKPVDVTVLEGVEELKWRFLDQDREWQETWPKDGESMSAPSEQVPVPGAGGQNSAQPNRTPPPPRGVEVTITTKDWGELKFLFATGAGGVTPQMLAQIGQTSNVPGQGGCPAGARSCVPREPPGEEPPPDDPPSDDPPPEE